MELGETASAEGVLARIEEAARSHPSAYSESIALQIRGELAARVGDERIARQLLSRSRLLWGDPPNVWSLARLLKEQGEYREASALFRELLRRKGEILLWDFAGSWVLAHLHLARCQRHLGNEMDARER